MTVSPRERAGHASTEPTSAVATVRSAADGPDDLTLIVRAREGDLNAFEILVRRYQRPIYQLAWRMLGNSSDAEDVAQEVFLTAWRRLPELREDGAFAGWLYRSASNRCINRLRGRRPTTELPADTSAEHPVEQTPGTDPEQAAQTSAQMKALTTAIGELTPDQRAVWLLFEVHGRSYAEIARIVRTSPQAVRGRLARARVQLAERMRPWQ